MSRLKLQARTHLSWLALAGGPQPATRTVEVLPPSLLDEASWVFLTGAFVCLCVIYIVAFQVHASGQPGGAARNANLPSYMALFRDLPSPEQRIFREMQEGMQEALRIRGVDGSWPTVESLAAQGIPPFARDVLDKSALRWTRRDDRLLVEYIGVPASGPDMPAFVILTIEPEPTGGEQPAAGVVDEEHQLLPDGKLLHVTYWKHASTSISASPINDPASEGWTQIRVTNPFQITEEP